jgi:Arc/MetJ-type ribon-helix-helix transcriptional regulator
MTKSDTFAIVPRDRAISVRLDPDADAALGRLVASGLTQSQAMRLALVEAARRRAGDSSLAAEAARLAADERDRREIADVRAFMDELRAEG